MYDRHLPRATGPLTMTGVVHAVGHGDRDAGTEVVLRVESVYVILTRLRKPYHYEHDFTGLALTPRAASTRTCSGWATAVSAAPCSRSTRRCPTRTSRPRIIPPSNAPLDGADE